jgi:putative peptidoglycan lipid II flippase
MFRLPTRAVSWRVLLQMITVGVWTGIVKIAGALRVIVTARAFGTTDGLDAYLAAFLLPAFVADTLAGSLTSSLIPTFIEVRELEGRAASERLYRSVLSAATALLASAALIVGVAAPWIFRLLASNFDPNKIALACSLFWVMLPTIPLAALATPWRAILNTEGRFALPAILPAFQPIASIALLFAFGRTWGVYTLALGTLIGVAAETALLGLAMHRRGHPILPRWFGRDRAFSQVLAEYAPAISSAILLAGTPLIDQSIAAMLGPGSVAALNYGTRISAVLIVMGPSAVATAILPHFSRLTISADWEHLRQSLKSYATIILAFTLPAIALLIVFSEPIVRLVYQRGEFTTGATGLVTRVQRFAMLQIPIGMVMALALRLVSSIKANRLLVRVAAFYILANITLDYTLARTMGIAGITLSSAIVQFAALLYLFRRMRTRLPASFTAVPTRAAAS